MLENYILRKEPTAKVNPQQTKDTKVIIKPQMTELRNTRNNKYHVELRDYSGKLTK